MELITILNVFAVVSASLCEVRTLFTVGQHPSCRIDVGEETRWLGRTM